MPSANDSFLARLNGTKRFLTFFKELAEREDLVLGSCDVTLFVYFYDIYDRKRGRQFANFESVATRRSNMGIVFAPISNDLRGNTCALIAHELLHTFGASDKYSESGCVFPHGFAEPDRKPLYPQPKAEIMALGLPVAPGSEEPIVDLRKCVVGRKTAEEINWRR